MQMRSSREAEALQDGAVDFPWDDLTAEDHAALERMAALLQPECSALAREWSRRLMAALPEQFAVEGFTPESLDRLHAALLEVVLQRIAAGDTAGLYRTYYDLMRGFVEVDLRQRQIGRA